VSGACIANLEVETLQHKKPTFHGDTIYAETRVLEKHESTSKPDRGNRRGRVVGSISAAKRSATSVASSWCTARLRTAPSASVLVTRVTAAQPAADCLFCRIISGEVAAHVVLESEVAVAFLDHRPVFKGHAIVVPRAHVVTLTDLPAPLVGPFFSECSA